jgi:CCR4-NOT transcription complex subunit 1
MSLFPTKIFISRWNNRPAQIQFLTEAVKIAPEIFTMCKSINRLVVTKETFPMNNATRFFINGSLQSCWNSLDLIELLIEYSAIVQSPAESCSDLIELGLEQAPDLLLLALSMLNASWSDLVKDLAPKLVIAMISGHIHSQIILPKVWEMNPSIVIAGFVLMYRNDNTSLSRILDVSQDLKALTRVLEAKPYAFAIDLAALASRREYLNLGKWLQERIQKEKEIFFHSCLDFLNEKMTVMSSGRPEVNPTVPLTSNVATIFARVLHSFRMEIPGIGPELSDYCDKTLTTCNQLIPRMDSYDEPSIETTTFPHDIEEEANSFFEKIYKGELSIPQVIDHLQRLKMSPNPRELETFKCMIHNLFDEYKFFARYPDRELLITGILFGVLVQNQLVTSMALGIALRYVLEALRQPAGSKLFQFGVQALAQFQDRLPEWPQYCALLLQIDYLHQTLPEVVHLISSFQNHQNGPPGDLNMMNPSMIQPEDEGTLFKALQLRGILLEPYSISFDIPNEQVQDQVLFIINNLSTTNLAEKVTKVIHTLSPQYVRWFCHYIVVKRASIEPNFHSVYVSFMDQLPVPNIESNLLFETLSSIRNLLNSEKTVNSSQERSYLKNLGAWLGAISLAKNKPIRHKNLAFKELLLEGYEHKRLIVVIPFVCKVLEQSSASLVFHPPNPWIMAIMKLLAELYHFADLKLNLKFEIEVLCKNIKMDIKDIEPCNILRNCIANPQKNPTPPYGSRRGLESNSQEDIQSIGLPNLAQFIVFNPNITLFNTHSNLKRIVHIAIDRSIREVIQSPLVERSVTIAIVATKDVVQKDFALEPNEEKMRKAAHSMVQSLAGSLASVSSREPLKVSMISNLRTLLSTNGFTEQTISEQLIFVIVSDNLDLACSVMEKAAAEKSIPDIDESLMSSFVSRRKHREQRNGQAFYDPVAYGSSRYLSALPESLRLRPGGLSSGQLNVYDDFSRIHQPQPAPDQVVRIRPEARSDVESEASGLFPLPLAIEKFNTVIQDLDRLITEYGSASLESLGPQHVIKLTVQQLFWIISQTANPDNCCLLIAERLVGYIYSNASKLAKEVYILILRRFFELSKALPRELKEWFLYNEDKRKYDADIYSAVIKADIIAPHEVDLHLARLIEHDTGNISFAIGLISMTCLAESPICLYTDFLYTLACIKKAIANGVEVEVAQHLVQQLEERTALKELARLYKSNADLNTVETRRVLSLVFEEWVEIASHLGTSTSTQNSFIAELLEQNIICTDESLPLFIRICFELGLQSAMTVKTENIASMNPFIALDALSRFIVLLIKNMKGDERFSAATSLKLARKIFSVISVVLVFAHEKTKVRFDQKPFFRFFSSLLNDLKEFQFEFQNTYYSLLCLLSNTLYSLSPKVAPGFSFSWVQLLCHRNFLPPLLLCDNQKCWPFFHKLLLEHFTILEPQLRNNSLNNTSRVLYRATLRILLILLHDFPEYLTSYHHSLVNVIPVNCIQLRNLILSAFPSDMRLPDPFTPNLKVDLLPEINQSPKLLSDYTHILLSNDILSNLDSFLEKKIPVSFPSTVTKQFLNKNTLMENKYNVPLMNSFVLYVGIYDIEQSQRKNSDGATQLLPNSATSDLYQRILSELDPEGIQI